MKTLWTFVPSVDLGAGVRTNAIFVRGDIALTEGELDNMIDELPSLRSELSSLKSFLHKHNLTELYEQEQILNGER